MLNNNIIKMEIFDTTTSPKKSSIEDISEPNNYELINVDLITELPDSLLNAYH